jgi:hypothetical protein
MARPCTLSEAPIFLRGEVEVAGMRPKNYNY